MAKSVHSTDFKKKIKKSTTDFAKAKPWKTSVRSAITTSKLISISCSL